MATTGAKKAAMLLRNLDPATAAELLQSAGPEMLTEIAVEVAVLERDGAGSDLASQEPIMEFSDLLQGHRAPRTGGEFAREMLQLVLGDQESQQVLTQVDQRLRTLDPFGRIRLAGASEIAEALAGESAQAASVILSELPPKKSAELLGLLDEGTSALAVACMAGSQAVSPATRQRIASIVQGRLEQIAKDRAENGQTEQSQQRYRKVAVLLRGLDVAQRDQLIAALVEQDGETAESVQKYMVTWSDINIVGSRSLQEALSKAEGRELALALVDADPQVQEIIKENISERARDMLEEEISLLSSTKAADIEQAREKILDMLREMNKRGELEFEAN